MQGKFYRPVKQQLTLRLDADVVQWFKSHAGARGYQTRINAALRRFVEQETKRAAAERPDIFSDWAEKRVRREGSAGAWGRASLAALWGTVGAPIAWVVLAPLLGGGSDAVLYALALSALLSLAGYEVMLRLIRRRSR